MEMGIPWYLRGLVPGPPSDTSVCGCSSPSHKVGKWWRVTHTPSPRLRIPSGLLGAPDSAKAVCVLVALDCAGEGQQEQSLYGVRCRRSRQPRRPNAVPAVGSNGTFLSVIFNLQSVESLDMGGWLCMSE